MLAFLRRYWLLIPIAAVFAVAVFLEWSHQGPPPVHASSAPQTAPPAASQPPVPKPSQPASDQQTPATNTNQNQQPAAQTNSATNSLIAQQGNAEATPESVEAAATETVAHYTEILAWLTGVLAAVGLVTSCFTLWQILLARAEFNASHRGQLEVRFVRDIPADGGVEITVINTGTGKATFISARAMRRAISLSDPSPHDIPVESKFALRTDFAPSESDRHTITFRDGGRQPDSIFGWIIYDTTDGARRTTYFGRTYNWGSEQYVDAGGPDWNLIQ
jgi:hypothetical protein